MSPSPAAAAADPDSARQPAHCRGSACAIGRRRCLRPAGSLTASRDRRGPRGTCRCPRARPRRARQSRRLLQRVSSSRPRGADAHGRADRPPGRGRHRRGRRGRGGGSDHLRLGRPAPAAGTAPRDGSVVSRRTIDEVVRESRRATSRSSSSAASRTCERILAPVRGGPHAELALAYAAALGRYFDARRRRHARRSPDVSRRRPCPDRACPARLRAQRTPMSRRDRCWSRARTSPASIIARGRVRPAGRDGRRGGRAGHRGQTSRRALRRAPGDRRAARAHQRHRRQDTRAARAGTLFEQRADAGRDARSRRSRGRAGSQRRRRASTAGSPSRTTTTRSSPTLAGSSRSRRSRA